MLRREDFNELLRLIEDSASIDTGKMFKLAKWVTKIGTKSPLAVKLMDPDLQEYDLEESIAIYVKRLYCSYDKPTLGITLKSCTCEWIWK